MTADGRPITGASATIAIARDGAHVVMSLAVSLPQSGQPQAVLIPLPGPMTQPRAAPFNVAWLNPLLAETAPRLVAIADPDPCFAHPEPPPLAPVRADTAIPGEFEPPDYALFDSPGRGLADWLAARGLPSPTLPQHGAPILALGVPRTTTPHAATVTAVQLRYDAPQVTVPALPENTDATVLSLTRDGRTEPVALANRRMPTGAELPEFVLNQFAHFYSAALHQAGAAALTEFAGFDTADLTSLGAAWRESAGVFVTRLHLHQSPDTTLGETTEIAPFRVEYRARIGWKGQYTLACSAGFDYRHALTARWQAENATLAGLTGWQPEAIRHAMVAQWQRTRESPD